MKVNDVDANDGVAKGEDVREEDAREVKVQGDGRSEDETVDINCDAVL